MIPIPFLSAHNLTRSFAVRSSKGPWWRSWGQHSTKYAIKDINLEIAQGEAVGYLGPNGAGKSTTIKLLTGIMRPTAGEVLCLGQSIWRDRHSYLHRIGCVFGQRSQLLWDLPVDRSFRLLQTIYSIEPVAYIRRVEELADILDLDPLLNTPVRQLSLGQRMRCEVAAALLHRPSLLFLDEPTVGLDVTAKQRIRAFLQRENLDRGTTMVITSHDLRDIEQLCRRVVVIDKGQLVFDGTTDELKHRFAGYRTLVLDVVGRMDENLPEGVVLTKREGDRYWLRFPAAAYTVVSLTALLANSCEIADLSVQEPDLEEVLGTLYAAG